ncbi:GntR family transcriptional regulator [Streptococcus catagoni]|uniref:GntR family transcriptional regulator n=1 Tax=Streptococcus catagoni TaxID=2654874 RepID=UPI00140E5F1D|nr:LacI family DNA-binding transcriptional regulator [Streptococcus catagoni]
MKELLYKKIYHYLKEQISSGYLKVGEQLPTEKELSDQFSVSRITSKRALVELEQEGLISRSRGKGSFVNAPVPSESSTSKDILLVLPFASDFELADYAKGIMAAITDKGYRLIVQLVDQIKLDQLEDFAGLIFYPEDVHKSIDLLYFCHEKEIPLVLLDKRIPSFNFPAVVADNQKGSYHLTKHLIEEACQEIIFVGCESFGEVSSVRDRYLGYLKALSQASLSSKHWINLDNGSTNHYVDSLLDYIATKKGRKVGLVVENDWLAVQVLQKVKEAAYQVPDQVAIVGFDNIQASVLLNPQLTTAAQNYFKMGNDAANLLLEMILKGVKRAKIEKVPVELYIRQSSRRY